MTRVHSNAFGVSVPSELEAAREAFLDLIANAYEFSEDVDGEYDSEGRAYGTVTYTLRFDRGTLEDLIESLCIVQLLGESPKEAIDRANVAIDGPDDGWIKWHGGENPAPGQVVEWRNAAGTQARFLSDDVAGLGKPLGRNSPIVAYRLIAPVIAKATGADQ